MKALKKILIVLCLAIIISGMIYLAKNGVNEGSITQRALIQNAEQLLPYISESTVIILIYFGIKYKKQNSAKVLVKSIIALLGAPALVLAITALTRLQVSRLFPSIMLVVYVITTIVLSAYFEKNT